MLYLHWLISHCSPSLSWIDDFNTWACATLCAPLSLRPLTCDDMKGHRWGPWEQSGMHVLLETKASVMKTRKTRTADPNWMTSGEFPKLPAHGKAERRCCGSLQGAEPFWLALCSVNISHVLIKTAKGHDPAMIHVGYFFKSTDGKLHEPAVTLRKLLGID